MNPIFCKVEHNPDAGTYGDCVRACVATILDLPSDAVPHFYHDNDAAKAMSRMVEWLRLRCYAPFWSHYPDMPIDALLEYMDGCNPDVVYMLIGALASGGNHAVVCKGGEIVHNPAWMPSPLIGPAQNGFWSVMVVARV